MKTVLVEQKNCGEFIKVKRHIIEFIFPEVCYLKDKEERLKDMTQEEKDLVLQDLCARLPYGVKFATKYSHFNDTHELLVINKHSTIVETFKMLWWDIEDVKPYLRPMSSMTEEERQEYGLVLCDELSINQFDWLNKNMFDYRGLIPRGRAIEATEGMYNN